MHGVRRARAGNPSYPEAAHDEEDVVAEIEYTPEDIEAINTEIIDLKKFRDLAQKIRINSKAERLIIALEKAFVEIEKLGANQKALIFTESRRTQEFIYNLLEARGYKNKVVQFNGSNTDGKSKEIYKNWLLEHKETDKITGSPTADKRAALVDYFKEEATIMIATEAAAEGINLQFCSLIVNFDLPWNPQRIEQRIGRCHRYGQKHDVVVVNFLNIKNAADQRVYELLDQKFQLFDGVFGSSDEVLGAIGNGVDFEKRIAQIYNDCRTIEEIKDAFDSLQDELRPEISEKIQTVRTTLLEHFDEEVKEKLKSNLLETRQHLNTFEDKLWKTTQYFLKDYAEFSNDFSFKLIKNPFPKENIHNGPYMILKPKEGQKKSDIFIPDDTNIYRIGHKLAQRILKSCKENETLTKEVVFDYSSTPTKVTVLEKYIGKSGWLQIDHLCVNSFEEEDYVLLACYSDDSETIPAETAQRFFSLYADENEMISISNETSTVLKDLIQVERQGIISENTNRNRDFFDVEMDKLDQWADDMKISLEKEIRDLDAEIKLRKAEAKKMLNLEAKVKSQRQIKELEKKRSEKRQTLFSAQDEIDDKKETLLTDIEKRLNQKIEQKQLFTIKWKII